MKLSFSKINLLAVAVLISFSSVNCGCPDGWGTIDNVSGFKIFTSTDPINLYMAVPVCKANGGIVAPLYTSDESGLIAQMVGNDTPVWVGAVMKNNGDGSFSCKMLDGGDCPSEIQSSFQNQPSDTATPIYGTQIINGNWNVVDCAERVFAVACKTTCDQ
ncbi:unnamed protein product [Meloidogyne enterolobii]|uniref:Uncharacterized protein n=1 Tax=Meloidogyne enterolobii TaxID=390850 RepID=A0ACB1AKJ3_MELEN